MNWNNRYQNISCKDKYDDKVNKMGLDFVLNQKNNL